MKFVRLAFALVLVSCASMLLAQTPGPGKDRAALAASEPLIVDVHSSPYRARIYPSTNIGDHRFDMRDATILQMITTAYDKDDATVLGGQSWIGFDRFDLTAKIDALRAPKSTLNPNRGIGPDAASSANKEANPFDLIRPVLQQVLAQRFHLIYHTEERPLPGYVMTVAKGAKLTEATDQTAEGNCQANEDKTTQGQYTIVCTSETPAKFLTSFGGVFPHKVVDHTGLTKSYDFTLTLALGQIRTEDEYVRVWMDALNKQAGLLVTPGDVPQPAMFIDKVDQTPTANQLNIAKLIPALPELEFEVASIRPSADSEPQGQIRPAGSQITFSGFSLQALLVRAFDLPTGAMLGNRPAWLDHVKYTVLVKLPPDIDARAVWQDQDQVDRMLQKLLVDRFQIKDHWGEETQDAYVLLPGTPKMKKADPAVRTSCEYGPAAGEKDMLAIPNSPFDQEFHCQNVKMAQFADLAQSMAWSEVKNRVPDRTGLAGAYDFTVYYTSGHKLRVDTAAADAATAPKQSGDAADPVAGMSLEDAFKKELGVRLEKQPLSVPVLILDHIEKTPTEN